jgi:hypothetical protein
MGEGGANDLSGREIIAHHLGPDPRAGRGKANKSFSARIPLWTLANMHEELGSNRSEFLVI